MCRYIYKDQRRCIFMQKTTTKPNRNNTSESIRLPNEVVDFLTALSSAKGISRHELISEICLTYIKNEQSRFAEV